MKRDKAIQSIEKIREKKVRMNREAQKKKNEVNRKPVAEWQIPFQSYQ